MAYNFCSKRDRSLRHKGKQTGELNYKMRTCKKVRRVKKFDQCNSRTSALADVSSNKLKRTTRFASRTFHLLEDYSNTTQFTYKYYSKNNSTKGYKKDSA